MDQICFPDLIGADCFIFDFFTRGHEQIFKDMLKVAWLVTFRVTNGITMKQVGFSSTTGCWLEERPFLFFEVMVFLPNDR